MYCSAKALATKSLVNTFGGMNFQTDLYGGQNKPTRLEDASFCCRTFL